MKTMYKTCNTERHQGNYVWDGEGLPPVGCECETLHDSVGSEWERVIIKWNNDKQFLYEWVRDEHPAHHVLAFVNQHQFRPIRTESEQKREDAVKALSQVVEYRKGCNDKAMSGWLYDAIAAGKIPGIRLTDDAGSQ